MPHSFNHIVPKFSDTLFRYIHTHFLVYNTSWEDSLADRELLEIDSGSSLLMITGAGCNTLAYLLDKPARITSVDTNYRQTALLDLKAALFREDNFERLYRLFGQGQSEYYQNDYRAVRNYLLKSSSKDYWDRYFRYFSSQGNGFYYQGSSGFFARLLNFMVDLKGLRSELNALLEGRSLEKRKELFAVIERKLWSGVSKHFWKMNSTLSLAGIPASQSEAVPDLNGFMKTVLPELFVRQDPSQNHYWKVYLKGHYSKNCCPEYLKEENFPVIKEGLTRLKYLTSGFIDYLSKTEESYTHMVLLDHMDWLAKNHRHLLKKEWSLIIKKSQPGARILFRSAYEDLSFLPPFAFEKVEFTRIDPFSLKHPDRVGTYTSTWLGVVQ